MLMVACREITSGDSGVSWAGSSFDRSCMPVARQFRAQKSSQQSEMAPHINQRNQLRALAAGLAPASTAGAPPQPDEATRRQEGSPRRRLTCSRRPFPFDAIAASLVEPLALC